MSKRKWLIYRHVSPSGKSYIGQTMQEPGVRWCAGKGYGHSYKFGVAIRKYGWENFKHEILEDNIDSREAANEREQYYIALYDSYENGYNSTRGGDNREHIGKGVYQIDKGMNVVGVFKSAAEAERELGILAQNILSCIKAEQISAGGYYWARVGEDLSRWHAPMTKRKRAVVCHETGEVYESLSEAARQSGICVTRISKCASHSLRSTGGLHWSYAEDAYENEQKKECPIIKKEENVPIICIETGEIFSSISECGACAGIDGQTLERRGCKEHKSIRGRHYAYLHEYDDTWRIAERFYTTRKRAPLPLRKKIYCKETRSIYECASEAGRALDIDSRLILECCKKNVESACGYTFSYLPDYRADK